ncbi:MAG: hypothetical protein WB710_19050 [Stellaceae bacterium]|jgi:hypothetical protein
MSLSFDDIKILIQWLGHDGARAGLEFSHLNVTELRNMAEAQGIRIPTKTRRADVVDHLMFLADQKIDKTLDEMLAMSSEGLLDYFDRTRPSRSELLRLLEKLDFHPGSEAQKSLYKYAARQISETGMFQRVARPSPSLTEDR